MGLEEIFAWIASLFGSSGGAATGAASLAPEALSVADLSGALNVGGPLGATSTAAAAPTAGGASGGMIGQARDVADLAGKLQRIFGLEPQQRLRPELPGVAAQSPPQRFKPTDTSNLPLQPRPLTGGPLAGGYGRGAPDMQRLMMLMRMLGR